MRHASDSGHARSSSLLESRGCHILVTLVYEFHFGFLQTRINMQKFAFPASKGEANHEVDKIDKSSQFICS